MIFLSSNVWRLYTDTNITDEPASFTLRVRSRWIQRVSAKRVYVSAKIWANIIAITLYSLLQLTYLFDITNHVVLLIFNK